MSYKIFSFFIFFIIEYKINSEKEIIFHRNYLLKGSPISINLQSYINYYIENIFTTEILIGEPSQILPAYLNPGKSGFYLTNRTCPIKKFYLYKKSTNYKLIDKISYDFYNIYYISDSLSFEKDQKSDKIDNYTILVDCELEESLCFVFGTKLESNDKEIQNSLLNNLHKNKYIQSYYYSYEVNNKNGNELKFIFDIDIKGNKDGYSFIKAYEYNDIKGKHIDWGVNFNILEINNSTKYLVYLRAELNINLGCLIAPNDFKKIFEQIYNENEVLAKQIIYGNNYHIYQFDYKYYEKLKNFRLDFYHKELNFHFILDYQDLFIEKSDTIFCLIIFEYKQIYHWKFGLPFLKKYKFIYNSDNKFIGFLKNNINKTVIENLSNIQNDTLKNDNNFVKIKTKIIIIVFLIFLLIIIGMVFFGILIGKKLYKIRKTKTNELLELYDYSSKSDKNF